MKESDLDLRFEDLDVAFTSKDSDRFLVLSADFIGDFEDDDGIKVDSDRLWLLLLLLPVLFSVVSILTRLFDGEWEDAKGGSDCDEKDDFRLRLRPRPPLPLRLLPPLPLVLFPILSLRFLSRV
mmetsp:Transcript_14552/g.18389  ORF Transcript_14552/g.18389 Transcript_14552/m.18389 type:complete len:124 (-) Transcript_14552:453-824(-)